ncbi:hypothetical protein [Sneathiella sp. HT1-7]|uniref:hypothetical protein n=1 Tax=Sneathiella sp. HT1-7 TaxID=2887192 RepID=UPI001D1428CB|nr:hypothetical protein [Sneathiella sp. HT1-7]MCC3304876.1 hypothetical protein [Sneathiella sp. HT1-7]
MIKINHDDVKIMLRIPQLTPDLRKILVSIPDGGNISNEQADELRDIVGERLTEIGFDENYEVNEEGKKFEDLIDKLFTG